jgi:membrane protein
MNHLKRTREINPMEAGSSHSRETKLDRTLLHLVAVAALLWVVGIPRRNALATSVTEATPESWPKVATTTRPPARSWKDVLLHLYNNVSNHRVLAIAAGIAFYSLLAIFPAIAALVSLYGLFADPVVISEQLNSLSGFLPSGAADVIRDQLTRVASRGNSTLGLTFVVGLVISLWSANAGIKSLFDALNIVYGEEEKRGLIRLNAISLLFTTAGIAFVLLALCVVVVMPVLLKDVGVDSMPTLLVRVGRWPLIFIVLTLALTLVYRYGPSREKAQWQWITWGGVFASIVWLAASILFSWYAANFGQFDQTYGSLGAVIGFMTWIWLSAIVVLVGAELDAEMEHRQAGESIP